MTHYVYLELEPQRYTVGFYDPNKKWYPESDHYDPEEAAKRVAYLNGTRFRESEEREFLVHWSIDVDARTPREAAEEARKIQLLRGSTAVVFTVTDRETNQAQQIDLLAIPEAKNRGEA